MHRVGADQRVDDFRAHQFRLDRQRDAVLAQAVQRVFGRHDFEKFSRRIFQRRLDAVPAIKKHRAVAVAHRRPPALARPEQRLWPVGCALFTKRRFAAERRLAAFVASVAAIGAIAAFGFAGAWRAFVTRGGARRPIGFIAGFFAVRLMTFRPAAIWPVAVRSVSVRSWRIAARGGGFAHGAFFHEWRGLAILVTDIGAGSRVRLAARHAPEGSSFRFPLACARRGTERRKALTKCRVSAIACECDRFNALASMRRTPRLPALHWRSFG